MITPNLSITIFYENSKIPQHLKASEPSCHSISSKASVYLTRLITRSPYFLRLQYWLWIPEVILFWKMFLKISPHHRQNILLGKPKTSIISQNQSPLYLSGIITSNIQLLIIFATIASTCNFFLRELILITLDWLTLTGDKIKLTFLLLLPGDYY